MTFLRRLVWLAVPPALAVSAAAISAAADPATVEEVTARREADGWTFSVTLSHPDTGWDHFASGWEILDPEGNRLGYRELTHPHVEEQPFTRSLAHVRVPEGLAYVLIRPRCTLDGWSGSPTRFDLP
ncbi:hypothetical protein [Albidovulum sp.]